MTKADLLIHLIATGKGIVSLLFTLGWLKLFGADGLSDLWRRGAWRISIPVGLGLAFIFGEILVSLGGYR